MKRQFHYKNVIDPHARFSTICRWDGPNFKAMFLALKVIAQTIFVAPKDLALNMSPNTNNSKDWILHGFLPARREMNQLTIKTQNDMTIGRLESRTTNHTTVNCVLLV